MARLHRFYLYLFIAIFGFFLGDFSTTQGLASSNELVTVYTSQNPQADVVVDKIFYNPKTGELFQSIDSPNLKLIEAFGQIPALAEHDLEVAAFAKVRFKDQSEHRLLAIRHGVWVSVLDIDNANPILSNIGPTEPPTSGEMAQRFVSGAKGELFLSFAGVISPIVSEKKQPPSSFIFLIDLNQDRPEIGWFPVRSDLSPIEVRVTHTEEGPIEYRFTYPITPTKKGNAERESGYVYVDMQTKRLYLQAGVGIISSTRLLKNHFSSQYMGPIEIERLPLYAALTTSDPMTIAATGSSKSVRPQAAAILAAQKRIDEAAAIEKAVRIGMAPLIGQPQALKTFVAIAQRAPTAKRFPVLIQGGPTGTGKTSSFHLFLKSLFPDMTDPVFEVPMAGKNAEMFNTLIYNSAPGYIGSTTPSPLQSWLLDHPDGGGILFDEADKAEPEVVKVLLSLLDKGEIRLAPTLVTTLVSKYAKSARSAWPKALYDGTDGGRYAEREVVLRLTPNHFVALGTNAGAELFNGKGASNVVGKSVTTRQALEQARALFTVDALKRSLRNRGFSDELLNRATDLIPYVPLLPEEQTLFVDRQLRLLLSVPSQSFQVYFTTTPELLAFLAKETFSPTDGARFALHNLDIWIGDAVRRAIVNERQIRPGDRVLLTVKPGAPGEASLLQMIRLYTDKVVAEVEIGKPPKPKPTALLARARERLLPTLERRIFGHREELKRFANAIISELSKSVRDPNRVGRPIVLYVDSVPGNGKTEMIKAIGEALFDDPNSLINIQMNAVTDLEAFNNNFVAPLTAASRTGTEYLLVLADEVHRAGSAHPVEQRAIQNKLLSIIDEGKLPPVRGEVTKVNGVMTESKESTDLPPLTFLFMTGNLAEQALGEGLERLTNRELNAHFRLLGRHPERFTAVFEKTFVAALRSRMGDPILLSPLTDYELGLLRRRFFAEFTKDLRNAGIEVTLGRSAEEYLEKYHVAIRGGRWPRREIQQHMEAPLNALISGRENEFKGAKIEIQWDDAAHEMRAAIDWSGAGAGTAIADPARAATTTDAAIVATGTAGADVATIGLDAAARATGGITSGVGRPNETVLLAKVPRNRAQLNPLVKSREQFKTSLHEAGHALVRRTLYGHNSVMEINTFGGGDGGWMESAFDVESHSLYSDTMNGPMQIAVSLGGHAAEVLYLPTGASEGASSDFSRARHVAQTMILNGSTLGFAPFPALTNSQTGALDLSERNRQKLETMQSAIMGYASRIARRILERDKSLLFKIAHALDNSPDLSLNREQFEALVDGQITPLTADELRALAKGDPNRAINNICEQLLGKR